MKTKCFDLKCKYCGKNWICKAKKIELEYNSINTKYQGIKDILICKTFEKSEEFESLEKMINQLSENKKPVAKINTIPMPIFRRRVCK